MVNKEFRLLGFQFDRILVEKDPLFKGKLTETSSNIDIKSINKEKMSLIDKEPIQINFSFNLKFGDMGKLEMLGRVIVLLDKESEKMVLEEWKNKKLPEDIRLVVLNIILQRSSLRALQLEEEVGLPLHIQFPRLRVQSPDSKKE